MTAVWVLDLPAALIAAIISVAGVLTVGAIQVLMNRWVHIDRVRREVATDRRRVFCELMAVAQRGDLVKATVQMAQERHDVVETLVHAVLSETEASAHLARDFEKATDKLFIALRARQVWADEAGAAQFAALASVTDPESPLHFAVKIPLNLRAEDSLNADGQELFLAALRVDSIPSPRRRRREERNFCEGLPASPAAQLVHSRMTAVAPDGDDENQEGAEIGDGPDSQ